MLRQWSGEVQLPTLCDAAGVVHRRHEPVCVCAAGLDIDGLYRVSGNLAVIQKLRYKADHGTSTEADGYSRPRVYAGSLHASMVTILVPPSLRDVTTRSQ